NAGLTEWPVPLLGRFDEAFLAVPPEVIQLTARVNQKYFICRDAAGKLANAFVCTANIVARDGGAAIIAGNRKVLAARLSDARFFWDQDQKTPLAEQAKKLGRITFHDKLGSLAEKVARVAGLAEWLARHNIVPGAKPKEARLAAELCKADLVTEMVGEFPELQGLMGGYYARVEGLPDAVADAIRDHYKPVGQGDDAPTAPVTVAVALADKLDTIASFFAIDEKPTGSKDPYALRRAALGVLQIILKNGLRFKIESAIDGIVASRIVGNYILAADEAADKIDDILWNNFDEIDAEKISISTRWAIAGDLQRPGLGQDFKDGIEKAVGAIRDFFADRLKVQQREAGVRHDLIDAVFALGGEDDLVRLLARVHALQAFVGTEDGVNLLAGYKR
ncbi:MAG: glycine--tRNA ligase subunit beta, partial [Alphaproteobacteria bacterium]|nr:glycine--tRNA ligase subunit beta [Alphaproteobacteria bacterium]